MREGDLVRVLHGASHWVGRVARVVSVELMDGKDWFWVDVDLCGAKLRFGSTEVELAEGLVEERMNSFGLPKINGGDCKKTGLGRGDDGDGG